MMLRTLRSFLQALLLGATMLSVLPASAQAPAAAVAEYRLGAGDVIRISVYQNPDLQLETRVSEARELAFVRQEARGFQQAAARPERLAKAQHAAVRLQSGV